MMRESLSFILCFSLFLILLPHNVRGLIVTSCANYNSLSGGTLDIFQNINTHEITENCIRVTNAVNVIIDGMSFINFV